MFFAHCFILLTMRHLTSLLFLFRVIFLFSNYIIINYISFSDCDIPSAFPPYLNLKWNKQFLINKTNNLKGQIPKPNKHKIEINYFDALQFSILGIGVFTFLWLTFMHVCTQVRYVSFNTNLNLYKKNKMLLPSSIGTQMHPILFVLGLLLLIIEYERSQIILLIILLNPDPVKVADLTLKYCKKIKIVYSGILSLVFHRRWTFGRFGEKYGRFPEKTWTFCLKPGRYIGRISQKW